jgi:enoyl-CoA hydratase/carnithine racemase
MLVAIAPDDSVRVLVVQSCVNGVFLLHGDARQAASMGRLFDDMATAHVVLGELHATLNCFASIPQVSIAKIAGLCRGGGMEVALAMDMRFAAKEVTRMGQPEVEMGLVPGAGGLTRLTHMLGRSRALEIILGSSDLSAEEAERFGIINRALAPDRLDAHVDRLARHIADLPPAAVVAAKRAVHAIAPALNFTVEIDAQASAATHSDLPGYAEGVLEAGMQRSLADEWDIDNLTAEGRRIARAKAC